MNTRTFWALGLASLGLIFAAPNSAFSASTDVSWDKVFEKSEKVDVKKVSFKNRFGVELVGDLHYKTDIIPFDKMEQFFKDNLM